MTQTVLKGSMRRWFALGSPAAIILLLLVAEPAATQTVSPIPVEPALDIAGLFWGQDAAVAKHQLANAGFQIVYEFGETPDFDGEVRTAAGNRLSALNLPDDQHTQEIEAKKGAETIEIEIKALPQGAVIWSVR